MISAIYETFRLLLEEYVPYVTIEAEKEICGYLAIKCVVITVTLSCSCCRCVWSAWTTRVKGQRRKPRIPGFARSHRFKWGDWSPGSSRILRIRSSGSNGCPWTKWVAGFHWSTRYTGIYRGNRLYWTSGQSR